MAKKTFKTDPELGKRAREAAKGVKRPNRLSKKKVETMAKVEIVKAELLRQGYLKEVKKHMPKIMAAHFKVAATPRASATQERKLLFETSGIKEDKGDDIGKTIGQVLAELANS